PRQPGPAQPGLPAPGRARKKPGAGPAQAIRCPGVERGQPQRAAWRQHPDALLQQLLARDAVIKDVLQQHGANGFTGQGQRQPAADRAIPFISHRPQYHAAPCGGCGCAGNSEPRPGQGRAARQDAANRLRLAAQQCLPCVTVEPAQCAGGGSRAALTLGKQEGHGRVLAAPGKGPPDSAPPAANGQTAPLADQEAPCNCIRCPHSTTTTSGCSAPPGRRWWSTRATPRRYSPPP